MELAYIDPGSGSLVIQAIIATIVAVPIVFQSTFRRILHGLRNRGQGNDK